MYEFIIGFIYGLYCKLWSLLFVNSIFVKSVSLTTNDYTIASKIRLMSYNVKAMFPYYYARRIDQVVAFISSQFENGLVDVVCLQEAFEDDFVMRLSAIAKKLDLHIICPPTNKKYYLGENSGLLTVSRVPIVGHNSLVYPMSTGLCGFANKGAHIIRFSGDFAIVNTHLQSDNCLVAVKQLDYLLNRIPEETALLCGDFNMNRRQMYKDGFTFCGPEQITFPETGEQLDHFIIARPDIRYSNFRVLTDVPCSDHYPICVEIFIGLKT
jgi:endonuclease/exonuclease/phosphatase family metal-dependent hydrolase